MLAALKIISPANLCCSRAKVVFWIVSKRSFVKQTQVSFNHFKVQRKVLSQFGDYQGCGFHTSRPRYIPPALAIILRPIVQIGAFFFGRAFKKWWKKKTPEEKRLYIEWFTKRKNSFYGENI